MKADQDQLERKLWADREAIHTKYQEKLKVAQTKLVMRLRLRDDAQLHVLTFFLFLFFCIRAQMIGATVSQHEITVRLYS